MDGQAFEEAVSNAMGGMAVSPARQDRRECPSVTTPPIRILNVVRFPIGGIRSYLRYTYARLDPRKFGTTILTVNRPEANLLPGAMAPMAVELVTIPEKHAFVRLIAGVRLALRDGRFDLVHSQGTTAAIASDFNIRRRVPHVITLHETFMPDQFSGAVGAIKRRMVERALRRSNAIIAVTDDARDNLFEQIPLDATTRAKVEVIRNGIATSALRQEALELKPDLRQSLQIPNETILLAYVGRFMPEKGFGVLLDAVDRLRNSQADLPKFVVVSVNDGAFLREYREAISQRGLTEHFLFTGFRSTAAGVLTEADAVIMPSLREACGLVAMEAMALGCPLVASDCIGLREVTKGTPALTSIAGDAASLAASIELLLKNRSQLSADARSFAVKAGQEFDSQQPADRLASVFERFL
jgi:glycosyltransferase involved in cell wall biosynthesis